VFCITIAYLRTLALKVGELTRFSYAPNPDRYRWNEITLSTSGCLALHLWYSLGLLNNSFPFEAILDLFCPFHEFQLLQVLPDIVFPSGLGSPYWSSCEWFPFVYFLYNTSFRHSICVSKPTQSLGFNIIYCVSSRSDIVGSRNDTQV